MENEKTSKCNNKEWEVSSAQLLKAHGYGNNYEAVAKANQQAKTAKELAKEILSLSRHTLFIHLRFMEAAFVKIVPDQDLDTLTMSLMESIFIIIQFISAGSLGWQKKFRYGTIFM